MSGKGDQFREAGLAGFILNILNESLANALIAVRGIYEQMGQFTDALLRVRMQGDTGNGVVVDLEQEIIFQHFFNGFFAAGYQPLFGHGFTGKPVDAGGIFLFRRTDLTVLVGIHQRAYAFIGEYFSQKAFSDEAIDQMYTWHSGGTGFSGVSGFGAMIFGNAIGLIGESGL